ncbi:hypothetical protein [Caballeronia glebae]|uniref:hypothetical protein n=1 Tax=Caballeronia glebae TaxID=1777143 RepID=UPI0038BB7298
MRTGLCSVKFPGDRFIDKRLDYIKYSSKLRGLAADKFARLVAEGYFVLMKDKTIGKFYEVAPQFKPSVRKFLSDNYPDGRIKRFIAAVR